MAWDDYADEIETGELDEHVEFSDIPLLEQVIDAKDSFRKPVGVIYPPEDYQFKNQYLGKKGLKLYYAMRSKWGLGKLIPFDKIDELGRTMGYPRRNTAVLCSKMWGRGLVKKWGAGIYREGWLKRSENKVGKYYGVHYEIIK